MIPLSLQFCFALSLSNLIVIVLAILPKDINRQAKNKSKNPDPRGYSVHLAW